MKKNILYVTRHFPPEISGGARRPYLSVKYLKKFGYNITTVTPFHNKDHTFDNIEIQTKYINNALMKQSGQVVGATSLLNIIKSFIRTWAFYPDPNIRWAHKVTKSISNLNQYCAVITTSPPESTHYVGYLLSRRYNIPWIAEFRDTWFESPHRVELERHLIRRIFERELAKLWLKRCSGIICISDYIYRDICNYAPHDLPASIIGHFSEVYSSSNQESLSSFSPFDKKSLNLLHSGGFELSDHNRCLSTLLDYLCTIPTGKYPIILHITGQLSQRELYLLKNEKRLKVINHGPVSLDRSRFFQSICDALLLYTPSESHALPGKYSEYVLSKKPIYILGGGSWTSLVSDTSRLRPLHDIYRLRKGETVEIDSEYLAEEAVKRMSAFIDYILNKNA
ncbi:glycosyltransferase family protein [Woodsholea maritima]|uniref:hypothetical protein n=1 Tax=Woodsholea maritima TaxID=240237 RepID=UPI0003A614CE|nr:hypothetical protein [Woodsholea maritima]